MQGSPYDVMMVVQASGARTCQTCLRMSNDTPLSTGHRSCYLKVKAVVPT